MATLWLQVFINKLRQLLERNIISSRELRQTALDIYCGHRTQPPVRRCCLVDCCEQTMQCRTSWQGTNQLLGSDVISTTVVVLTGHCVMGRHAERVRLSFNEEEEIIIHFLCQCPFHARCWYRLFDSPFLVSLAELPSIDIKDIASYIELSGWFSSVV